MSKIKNSISKQLKEFLPKKKIKEFLAQKQLKEFLAQKQLKEFLSVNNLIIKKNKSFFVNNNFKSFYYTVLSAFLIIFLSFLLPSIIEFQNNNIFVSKEIENKSKSNLKKVLDLIKEIKPIKI